MSQDLITTGFNTELGFALLEKQANIFAQSTIVPQTFQKNIANCMIALEMAARMKASPLMVMQNLYIVYGIPSWSSKFLIATINTCGRYSSLDYEAVGEDPREPGYRLRAYAIERETGRQLNGEWIDWPLVKEEGWDKPKKNKTTGVETLSKWATMPGQMFRYRAAAFWQRAYCPEIAMGLLTAEEAHDMREEKEVYATTVPQGNPMEQLRKASAAIENNVIHQDKSQETNHSVIHSFAEIGISKERLEKKLGHPLGESTPEETAELRRLYKAIRMGASPEEIFGKEEDEIELLRQKELSNQYKMASGGE